MEHSRKPGRKSGVMSAIAMERPVVAHDLIRELQRGDRETLGSLLDVHGEDLMRYLYALTGDRHLAEDIFQDTWVRVMEKARSVDPRKDFAPWLFRIARNRALDLLRSKKSRHTQSMEDSSTPAWFSGDPADFLEQERVRAALARLPVKHREILGLRFYLDKSYDEMAALLRLPMGTVKSRLKRALDRLARAFHEENLHE